MVLSSGPLRDERPFMRPILRVVSPMGLSPPILGPAAAAGQAGGWCHEVFPKHSTESSP